MPRTPKFAKAAINNFKSEMADLEGATITGADGVYLDNQVWPYLMATTKDGSEVVIQPLSDPEGNGPGHIVHKKA